MRYLSLLAFLVFFACGDSSSNDAPAPPDELGLETVPEEQPVVEPREIEDYNPDGDERKLEDLIVVENVVAEQAITSPFTVRGKARGTWFFEGSFPVALTDENGQLLAESFGHSPESWMTTEFIPFSVDLEFDAPAGTRGSLELMLGNPAGDEGKDRAIIIPVVFE